MTTFRTIHFFDTDDGVQEKQFDYETFEEALFKATQLRNRDQVADVYLVEGSTANYGTHTERVVLLPH